MKDKVSQVSDYILDKIECGEYKAGELIPAARKLTEEIGVSFAIVQHAVNFLANAGILRSISRHGTIVMENWKTRIMPNHMFIFRPKRELVWIPEFRDVLMKRLPDFRLCQSFDAGMFELRTTLYVQEHRNEYLDLAPYFKELFPDPSIFFEIPFKYFRNSDGSMFALPFIFSPKVMFYNKETLKKANCPLPSPKWEWKDFIHSIKILKKIIPPGFILNYCSAPHFWMNFVFLNGGALLEPDAEDPVRIDSPETIAGIQAVRELYEILGGHELHISYPDSFLSGETPFLLSERETLCYLNHHNFDNWGIVPLPAMPGGRKMVAQATDLICIRKECADSERIFRFLSFMLSENVQDFIAREKYGIPIRKTSAWKTIDQTDPRDVLFLIEMNHMTAEYNLDSPELMTLVQNGITQIIRDRTKPLHESLKKLADAVRTLLEIKKCNNETNTGA